MLCQMSGLQLHPSTPRQSSVPLSSGKCFLSAFINRDQGEMQLLTCGQYPPTTRHCCAPPPACMPGGPPCRLRQAAGARATAGCRWQPRPCPAGGPRRSRAAGLQREGRLSSRGMLPRMWPCCLSAAKPGGGTTHEVLAPEDAGKSRAPPAKTGALSASDWLLIVKAPSTGMSALQKSCYHKATRAASKFMAITECWQVLRQEAQCLPVTRGRPEESGCAGSRDHWCGQLV